MEARQLELIISYLTFYIGYWNFENNQSTVKVQHYWHIRLYCTPFYAAEV